MQNARLYHATLKFVTSSYWVLVNLSHEMQLDPPFDWIPLMQHLRKTLLNLPEYADYCAQLKADPRIGSQLGLGLSFGTGTRVITEEDISITMLVWILKSTRESLKESTVLQIYEEFESFLYEREYVLNVVMYLPNVRTEVHETIDEFTIDHLEQWEIDYLSTSDYNCNQLLFRENANTSCVRITLRGEKTTYVPQPHVLPPMKHIEYQDRLEAFLNNLQIILGRKVIRGPVIQWVNEPFGRGRSASLPLNIVPGNQIVMTDRDVARLQEFWSIANHEGVLRRKHLGLALRRLGMAAERDNDEDRIIDQLIAAESLVLTSTGDPSFRNELTYRLSIRLAYLLAESNGKRREIYRHMRDAYNLRSGNVHGGDLRLPKRNGVAVPLNQFVKQTGDYLLLAFIQLATRATENVPVRKREMEFVIENWEEELLFPL